MALEGLLYGSGREELVNDKAGFPIYTGTATHFEEWEFRVTAKWKALENDEKKEQKRTELASKVTDALRDDAMKIAQDIGLDALIQKDGVPGLVTAMRNSVSVKRDLEAMQLYKEGSKVKGLLSRQTGESMQSYVLRRKRWWTRLTALDEKYFRHIEKYISSRASPVSTDVQPTHSETYTHTHTK